MPEPTDARLMGESSSRELQPILRAGSPFCERVSHDMLKHQRQHAAQRLSGAAQQQALIPTAPLVVSFEGLGTASRSS